MKRLSLVLLIASFVVAGAVRAETKSGPAKFTGVGNETVNVALGGKLKLNATFKMIQVGPAFGISLGATLKNTTNAKLNYAYHVAFLDKDKNLVGCQQSTLFIDGNKDTTTGTFVLLPPDEIARIAYYSVAFYESEKQIGSK